MQLRDVHELNIPQFGQRFSPSVDVAYGFSRVSRSRSFRWRRSMISIAAIPMQVAAIRSRSWVV